mmetsp:Transcript_9636/g.28152  ORF Transcript_9636/g.28152 Transcript_9636/m.28152 type:complete len:461 (-) Transcript_9636:43-1425(-)
MTSSGTTRTCGSPRSARSGSKKTHDKIVERGRRARIRKYDKEAEDELRRRRERLAKLYSEEMAQWRHEVATSGKSAADRKAEVEAKALELGRQREVARKKHNDWAYAQQRRNSLDDVRKRDSKAFVEACLSTRHLQHEEKARRLQKEKEEEEAWLKKWREGLAEADRIEAEKVAKHKAHEHDVKYVLDEQVELKKKRYRAREERMKKEAEEELAEWKIAVDAEAKKQIDLRDAARARSADVMGFNSVFDQKKEVFKKEQLRRDKLTLQYELDLQKAQDDKDAAKIQAEKELNARFKKYLDGFEKLKGADEAKIEAVRRKLENRIWDERDRAFQAEIDAREYLRKQVDLGRQQQIRDKIAAEKFSTSHYGAEIAAIEAAQKKANDEDDRRQAYQKQAAIDHQSKLRLQIERNKVRRAEEKQAEFLEKKYIEKVEAEHAYIVANEGGRCNIHHPIKSMKWFT